MLQRKFASCQAILDSHLLNIVGGDPPYTYQQSQWEFEMSRVPVAETYNGGSTIIDMVV